MTERVVKERGYYYNSAQKKLIEVDSGGNLPEGDWEFIGNSEEMKATEVLDKVRERYPDVDVAREVDFIPLFTRQ